MREQHHKREFVLKVTCKNTELLLDTGDKAKMEQWFVSLGKRLKVLLSVNWFFSNKITLEMTAFVLEIYDNYWVL